VCRKILFVLSLFLLFSALAASPANANQLASAAISANCNSYTVSVAGGNLDIPNATYAVQYTIYVTPSTGAPYTVSDSVAVAPDANLNFNASVTKGVGALSGTFSLTGTATLIASDGETFNTVNISFTPNPLVCGTPPPPPPQACTATATNSSNFNGTSVAAGAYIWFNAHFKATNVPSSGTTIDFTNGNISFSAGGTSYSLAVPNAKITFSASASCTSTTFDTVTNTWITTVPISGDDEVFLTGLAWPVPSGGLPGGANPVNFSGTYSSENNAPGLSIQMQWSAAAYSSFTTDYNALQIKAGHQTACGPSNGDHSGTPEGVDNSNTPWKKHLVGGPRGGGGSNFTGSWSGTLNINICP
jgi:hypothetical protein